MFVWKKSSWKKDSRRTPLHFSIECISPLLSRKSLPSNFTESFSRKYSSLKTSAWFHLSSAETCIRWLWRRKPELRCLSVGELSDRPGLDSASHRGCCLDIVCVKKQWTRFSRFVSLKRLEKAKSEMKWGFISLKVAPLVPDVDWYSLTRKKISTKQTQPKYLLG